MAENVKIIPLREKGSSVLRVVAYCRVSTDHSEQVLPYASQIRNYTDLINGHEGWELVDVYADEVVSGAKTDKREDFNRMLSNCRKGRIDKVLAKSLSVSLGTRRTALFAAGADAPWRYRPIQMATRRNRRT